MPDISEIFDVVDTTWPAAEKIPAGSLTLRRGAGGGKRVSAATANGPVLPEEVDVAELRMREMGQVPLFSLRPWDEALDALLAARGYGVADVTNVLICPIDRIADVEIAREQAGMPVWEPLAIQLDMWAEGGIGRDRLAVMERAQCTKTTLIGRNDQIPGGTCYIGVHKGIAMMHALEVPKAARRTGMGRALTVQAAQWARKHGATEFSCLCVESNMPANALYTKLGMEIVGQYHYRIKEH